MTHSSGHETDAQAQPRDISLVWDKVAENYSAQNVKRASYQAFLHILLEATGDPRGRTYCEVGCGSGTTSAMLAQLGARTSLVDIASKALEFARKHFEQLGLEGTYYQQDALAMNLPDDSFDVVWNGGVIEHFYDPGKVQLIREMWRITRPGGRLFIAVPSQLDFPFIVAKKLAQWRGTWGYGYEDDLTFGRFGALARKAGLDDYELFAYDPIAGWQFLPGGRRLTQILGLDTLQRHIKRWRFGHVICLCAQKPEGLAAKSGRS